MYACYTTTQAKKEKSTLGCNPCWSPPAAACSRSRNSVNWHITTNNSGFPWDSLSGLCRLCGEAYNHALLDERNTSWEMDYLIFLVLCQHLDLASHMCVWQTWITLCCLCAMETKLGIRQWLSFRICRGQPDSSVVDSVQILYYRSRVPAPDWQILDRHSTAVLSSKPSLEDPKQVLYCWAYLLTIF